MSQRIFNSKNHITREIRIKAISCVYHHAIFKYFKMVRILFPNQLALFLTRPASSSALVSSAIKNLTRRQMVPPPPVG